MATNRGAVYEYLEKLYGGYVRPVETLVTATTVRFNVVGNNPDRVALTLCNVGAESVFVWTTQQDFAAGVGIRLGPSGGLLTVNLVEDSIMPSLAWFGKASPAASSLFVVETVREASGG